MDGPELDTEQVRILMAIASSGFGGTGAEAVAARTGLDKSKVLSVIGGLWDSGMIEQVEGIRAVYRATQAGQDQLG